MYSRDTPYIVKSSQECENMAFWVIEEKRGGSSMLGKSLYIIVYCDQDFRKHKGILNYYFLIVKYTIFIKVV